MTCIVIILYHAIVIEPKINASTYDVHNNITAEVLYSTRTLVVNVSQLLALHVGFISGQLPRWLFVATLFASIRAICVLPHQLDGKRSPRCALVKTKNRSLLRHRGGNIACGHQMATWKFERTVGRNLGSAPRAIFG